MKLKPCPFCGGQAEFGRRPGMQSWVECMNPACGNKTGIWGGDQPAAFAWNRRANGESR